MNVTDLCNTSTTATSSTNNNNTANNNNDTTQCSLYIEHPTKSFIIIADSIELKLKWLQALKQTIENCQDKLQMKQNDNVEDGTIDESRNSRSSTSSNNTGLNDSVSNDLKDFDNRRTSMTKSPLRRTSSWRLS